MRKGQSCLSFNNLNFYKNQILILDSDFMLPACGQGALGIECRNNDTEIHKLLAPLHDEDTSLCVMVERRVNELLGGNCHTPLAIFCIIQNDLLYLRTKVAAENGQYVVAVSQKGQKSQGRQLAQTCVQELLEKGAGTLY